MAAEILAEAGQPDLAHVLHERAEEMERELHRRARAEAEYGERDSEIRQLHALIRELRDDVERLQDQVNELRELVEQKRD